MLAAATLLLTLLITGSTSLSGTFVYPVAQAEAAEKISGTLSVRDALTLPGQPARIEARLVRGSLVKEQGLGGEQLELVVEGKSVGRAMTGGDGRAFFEYTPKVRGNQKLTVKLVPNPRVTSPDATATLGSWERRRPILLVEVAALAQDQKALPLPVPSLPLMIGKAERPAPSSDAVDELTRLTQFFYNVIYLSWSPTGDADPITESGDVREWLRQHKFPTGLWMEVKPGERALGATIDELRAEGWTNVKAGIGRSRSFAEVLLAHRLEVVIVPEPDRGELPKKAKVAKGWKDVRKTL